MSKTPQAGIAEAIRVEIAKIPASELGYAKPSRVLPCLEAKGIAITPSVRTATSKLLAKVKKSIETGKVAEIVSFDQNTIEVRDAGERREAAMLLVEACGGNFALVLAEIARLQQFADRIKSA